MEKKIRKGSGIELESEVFFPEGFVHSSSQERSTIIGTFFLLYINGFPEDGVICQINAFMILLRIPLPAPCI